MGTQFGRYSLVSTTVNDPDHLPQHLLADETHVHLHGETVSVATTAGDDGLLGVSVASHADTESVQAADGVFRADVQQVQPSYQPTSVNTDGWSPTQTAWQTVFPHVTLIRCFLHAFVHIRARCKRLTTLMPTIHMDGWDTYHALTPTAVCTQLAALVTWVRNHMSGTALAAVEKLATNEASFLVAYTVPGAYRTSTMIDRLMNPMDRWLASTHGVHGHWISAERSIRAWALMQNFGPYCPRSAAAKHDCSPAHTLNGFVYQRNWLHHLLISTSCTGLKTAHRIR